MDSVEILDKIVSFNTRSSLSNLDLMAFIREYAMANKAQVETLRHPTEGKEALRIVIGDVEAGGGIAFAGHVDTVPAEGQAWTSDPFRLGRIGQRLQGRGAVDMKGFVACCLAAIPEIIKKNLDFPVHILLTYDEEVNAESAHLLMKDMAARNCLPDVCIVGEPTGMDVVMAQKSKLVATVTISGRSGHSSDPDGGVNAISVACRVVCWLDDQAERLRTAERRDKGFSPPFSTINVGRINGGTSVNIIPDRAVFEVEWRGIPGDDLHARLRDMQHFIEADLIPGTRRNGRECGVDVRIEGWYPTLQNDDNQDLAAWICRTIGTAARGGVSYATEAGVYQGCGVPTVICGPGNIAQAHRPDEWIDIDQLRKCERSILDLCMGFEKSGVDGRRTS
ncbi:acetylornithine deacetylase [Gluconacetobacter azotocaptans]|uniref:acetylornithine deacetylase n=1 Tax=Gluconacetobacter azotocaptans TaxID=142834 RepID=UPI0019567E77|nr:acetylornithine deacetylase [Gluconacetobacter azotocaptans]MBM9401473.1 acetylornithine deacetylase [Gluconacetobacter azotocaptans]